MILDILLDAIRMNSLIELREHGVFESVCVAEILLCAGV